MFDGGVQWKDWEVSGVAAVKDALGESNIWNDGDLLRRLHLAIAIRNEGISANDYTPEDIVESKALLEKSKVWFEENRQNWTPELRNKFRRAVFHQGRDKRGRPVAVIRPLEEERELWENNPEDLKSAIYGLTDDDMNKEYIPGVAEQATWIVDLGAVGLTDMPTLVPPLQVLITDLTANFTSRGGNIFIVNLSFMMNAAFRALMYFAQAETIEKIQCFSGGLEDIAAKYFDLESLPTLYGGSAPLACDMVEASSNQT